MYRVALCGLGSAAERAHLPALRELEADGAVQVVAVADPSPHRLDAAAVDLPGVQRFTALNALLARCDADILVVATPPSSHEQAVVAGLNAGLNVVCEKPLALTRTGLDAVGAAARTSPGALVTVHQYRHAPGWQPLAEAIADAVAHGDAVSIDVDVERPGTDPLSAGGWRADPRGEGGILGDHAVHYLALLTPLLPAMTVTSCERHGAGGRETAHILATAGSARAAIRVSYAGNSRHNRIRVTCPEHGRTLVWENDLLAVSHAGDRTVRSTTGSLADRDTVNALYAPFYREALTALAGPAGRRAATAESLLVGHHLVAALAAADIAAAAPSFAGDLRELARTVLLAFADMGIFLGSDRDRLLARARSLNTTDPGDLERFLDLAIGAGLITPADAGRLRLAPQQAARLADSLDAAGRFPDDQASAWAHALSGL